MCWRFAENGVDAALDARTNGTADTIWWSWYLLILFVACASGLIAIALRRAIRLQHETEGLV